MDPEGKKLSSARNWWLLIGGFVVFVVAFSLLEHLVGTESTGSRPAQDATSLTSPASPEVRRLDDGAVEIRHDFFRRSTIRLGNEDEGQAVLRLIRSRFGSSFRLGWGGPD
jgi:hypothetical protein